MELPAFEYHRPETPEQAVALMARFGESVCKGLARRIGGFVTRVRYG